MQSAQNESLDTLIPSKETSSGVRLLHLDGWRGVSILTVYLGHFLPLSFINNGRMGVELFFVLSGRLMAEILFVDRYPLDLFYRRRIARVWPAMVIFVLTMWLVFHQPGYLQVRWVDVVSALSLSLNYIRIYHHPMPVIEHVWSLCIEEWAYILLGLLAYVTRRLRLNPLPIIIVAAALCTANGIIQTMQGGDYYAVYWRTDTRIASILMSTAVYLYICREKLVAPGWVPLLCGIIGVLFSFTRVPDDLCYSIGTLCFAISVATVDTAPAWVMRLLSWRPLCQIGLWSFSLYLWQQPFAKLLWQAPRPILIGGAVMLGIASFYLVEQPLRRYLNSFHPRWPIWGVRARLTDSI